MSLNLKKYIFNPILTVRGYVGKFCRVSNLPSIAGIEVTNCCNLNCVICSRRYSQRPQGMMEFDLFANIIRQIKTTSRFTWLHLLGEPLLNPRLFDMIKLCGVNGLRVGISTNATMLTEECSKKLIESGLDSIILAFDGVNKETYERVRTGGVYEKVGANINNFLQLKKRLNKKKPWTVIQTVEINLTEGELEEFKSKWINSSADEILVRKYSTSAGQIGDRDAVAKPTHQYLAEQRKNRPPCFLLWNSAVIFWDGKVSTCCHDCVNGKLVFGDLKKDSLLKIWNSEKIEWLRGEHVKGNFPSICGHCLEYPLFYPSLSFFVKLGLKRLGLKFNLAKKKQKNIVTHAREQTYR